MRNNVSAKMMNTLLPVEGSYYAYVRFFAGAFYRAHFSKTVRT